MSQPTDEAAREAAYDAAAFQVLDAPDAGWSGGVTTGFRALGRALLERDATIAELRDEVAMTAHVGEEAYQDAMRQLVAERAAREKAERERDEAVAKEREACIQILSEMVLPAASLDDINPVATERMMQVYKNMAFCAAAEAIRYRLAPRETPEEGR